jgi:glycosyltransferase involved in cell wall biosynthesis
MNKQTITGCMIVQDEADWIRCSISGPLQVYDKVIVIDGGSQDDTVDIIKETARKHNAENKLLIIHNKFEHLNNQRNIYLEEAQTDWIHYIDADEVYKIDDLFAIKNNWIQDNKIECLLIRSHHFWHDFWHVSVNEGFERSYMMPKVFKNIRGKMHYQDYAPKLGDHTLFVNDVYFIEYWKGKFKLFNKDEIACYHYGHARTKERMERKIKFFLEQDEPEVDKSEYDKRLSEAGWFDPQWLNGINCDPKTVKKFNGEHPNVMKTHPMYEQIKIKD